MEKETPFRIVNIKKDKKLCKLYASLLKTVVAQEERQTASRIYSNLPKSLPAATLPMLF
jgi:hypothetical protein